MTEKQKLMTHRFLLELLVHKESDIRNQAAEVLGQIIAQFNEEYKKELAGRRHAAAQGCHESFPVGGYPARDPGAGLQADRAAQKMD